MIQPLFFASFYPRFKISTPKTVSTPVNQYRETLKVAYPIILGYVGLILTYMADNVMVGQLGKVPLAGASLANNVALIPVVFTIGLSMGITPLIGKAIGQENHTKISSYLYNSLWVFVTISILIFILLRFSSPIMYELNQPQEVVTQALPYFHILLWSMLPLVLSEVLSQLPNGMSITKPAMIFTLISNAVNIFLNYILIYGKMGFPAYGLEGAGYATLISRALLAVMLLLYLMRAPRFKRYFQGFKTAKIDLQLIRPLLKLGFPIAMQHVLEMGAFVVGAIIIGWYGSAQLAAHQVAIGIVAFTYRVSGGVGSAATIRISTYAGKKEGQNILKAGRSAFVMVLIFMSVCAVLVTLFSSYIPTWFVNENEVIILGAELLVIAAWFQVFDGVQVVALGALRGLEDVKTPTWIGLLSYWVVMLPLAYLFAEVLEMQATGVWIGYLIGLFIAAVLLYWRYHVVSRRSLEIHAN